MTKELTVGYFKQFLSQFTDDTVLDIQGHFNRSDLTENIDISEYFFSDQFSFSPAREEWTYVPTEEARSRGQVERTFPVIPAEITLGEYEN